MYTEKGEDTLSKEKGSEQEQDTITSAAGLAATQSAQVSTAKAKVDYAKPSKYTRNPMDSNAAKNAAKKQTFSGGKPVRDPYTGKTLELKQSVAKQKYGAAWQDHAAETDHVVPLKRVYEGHKSDPWVKTSDLKKIANDPDNLQVISRRINNHKLGSTNEDFVANQEAGIRLSSQAKKAAVQRGQAAQKAIDTKTRKVAVHNALHTGHEAGKASAINAGATTATISGILNITAVIRGDKDVDEALADTAVDVGRSAVGGYLLGNELTVLSHMLSNASSGFIRALAESNVPGQVITAVVMTGNTLSRYAQGEIDTRECLTELGEKGLTMATTGYSMAIGQTLIPIPVVGAAIGALVGSMMTSGYYHQLIDTLQTKQLEHEERLQIMEECRQAEAYAEQLQAELQMYIDSYFAEYRSCFAEALQQIRSAFESGDADGMVAGAAQITRKLGGRVAFDTVEGCRQYLLSDAVDEL